MKTLVSFEYDHADLVGFSIVNEKDLNQLFEDIGSYSYPHEVYHGNIYMRFDSEEDLTNCLTIHEVTHAEAESIKRIFNLKYESDSYNFDPLCLMTEY